ncbi:HNH endonuclease signature motif containing protein [Pseudoalteromonas agarivorans]|uniref:HNH endonuclease signature motif containing protein n=1 Tax=Pseudoalteromonas agarivorans TaxID=176102 RepID=UPI0022852926|nr:HNH endonuclease signature motif containing protein [Pseudoalteromonas agarivorans]
MNFIVGAVAGAALDAAIQYATTGEVDFGEVAVAAVAGAAGAGVVKNIGKVSKLFNKGSKPKLGSKGGPGAGKNFSEKTKEVARQESGNKCVFCGKKTIRSKTSHPDRSNIDHAISKKNGGNNTLDNAQNTCQTCNLEKGAKDTAEYLKSKTN